MICVFIFVLRCIDIVRLLAFSGILNLWYQSGKSSYDVEFANNFLRIFTITCGLLIANKIIDIHVLVVILMKNKLYGWLKEIFCHSENKTSIQVDGKAVFKVTLLHSSIQSLVNVLYAFTDQKTVLICVETVVIGMRGI